MKKSIKKYLPLIIFLFIGIFIGFTSHLYFKSISKKSYNSSSIRIFFSDKNFNLKPLSNNEKVIIKNISLKRDFCLAKLSNNERSILDSLKKEEDNIIISNNGNKDYKLIFLRIEEKEKVLAIKKFKKCLRDEINNLNINSSLKEIIKKMKIEEVVELFYGVNISLKS